MYEVYIEDSYMFHAGFISFPSSDIKVTIIQLTSTCSKLIIETLEKGRKYVQTDVSDVVVVFLLLTFEHTSYLSLVFLLLL